MKPKKYTQLQRIERLEAAVAKVYFMLQSIIQKEQKDERDKN